MNWEYSKYSKIDAEVKKYFPYTKARKNQLETISEIKYAIDKGYKYIVLEAGTGTGKSVIAATLSLIYDSSYILTVTKQLQDQYYNDFADLGFKLVKGRGNFRCRKYLEDGIDNSCDEGRCIIEGYHCQNSIRNMSSDKISQENTCFYDFQKWIALNSSVVISNYPYLFLELNYVGDFKKRKLMIFDEAHNLEDTLMNQLKLEFTRKELKDEIGINLSSIVVDELESGDYKSWIKFIVRVRNRFSEELNKIKNIKDSYIKEKINYFKHRIDDCDRFIKHINRDPSKWMFDYNSRYKVAEFKPVKVDGYAKNTFFEYGDVCLFMSATILDYKLFAEWLGINENEVYAIRQKSPFEINRNPIVTFSDYDMSYNNLSKTAPLTINSVKEILEKHKKDKGIIHTISYQCKDYLKRKLNSNRLIDHKTYNRASQLEKFKNSHNALVLISPSMGEGVDLPGDLCRFQIIYKIPFPSLGDKQTKLRSSIDSRWYKYKTALALVQTVGRGMRYEKDYCTTYFMDSRLNHFVDMDILTNNFLPETFINSINIEPAKIAEDDNSFNEVSIIRDDIKELIDDEFKEINLDDFNFDWDKKLESLDNFEDDLTFYEKVDLKYNLCLKGDQLLKNKRYDEAIVFYEDLLKNDLFKNDHHPYLKLSKAYHKNGDYEDEVKIIEKFFKSGIYCTKSKINGFKKILKKLDELGYYDYSNISELELEFELNGFKNKRYLGKPIPIAANIKRGKKNLNKKDVNYDSNEFDDLLNVDNNLNYNEKINLKYKLYLKGNELLDAKKYEKAIIFYNKLLNHELFINDYHPYLKLAVSYRKNKQYHKEVEIITNFFKSGIYCNKKKFDWFKKRLKELYKYGNYDFLSFNLLEKEFNKKGALNKDLSNIPVPIAADIKKYVSDDNLSEKVNLDNSNEYSREYFNKLAKEIQNNPDFISDRDLSKHTENDFIEIIENYDQINEKADLKNKGKELEKDDKMEAIKFYESLKSNELFKYDYYPYMRQCILFKNKIKDSQKDWDIIVDLFSHEIYCNPHQYIWLYNKILELTDKLSLSGDEKNKIDNLLKNYKKNEEKYFKLQQDNAIPITERILKDDEGLRLLSQEKYDFLQDMYYVKELGVGYIRRGEYETAISYYCNLLENDFLYYKYHAYKQLGRIFKEMNNPYEFKKLYENYLKR